MFLCCFQIDVNKDGKVSKEEFLKTYKKASSEVVNVEKMMADMQGHVGSH